MTTFKIDPEFKNLMPPLAADERALLRQSLQDEGCRDALIVWRGHDIIIDGHNRYELCRELGVPFEFNEMEFSDRPAAINWIVRNQLARRNLTDMQRIEFALKLKPQFAAAARIKRQLPGQTFGPVKTAEQIAALAGVSDETVRKAEVILRNGDHAVKEAARNGSVSISKAHTIAKLPPDQQHDALANAAHGRRSAPHESRLTHHESRPAHTAPPARIPGVWVTQLQAATDALMKEFDKPGYAISTIHVKSKATALHAIVQRIVAKSSD